MFAGLASPSHLIIALVIILLLFGAKRIPDLAKSLGTGIKELRDGLSTGGDAVAEAPDSEKVSSQARAGSGNETVRGHAGRRDR